MKGLDGRLSRLVRDCEFEVVVTVGGDLLHQRNEWRDGDRRQDGFARNLFVDREPESAQDGGDFLRAVASGGGNVAEVEYGGDAYAQQLFGSQFFGDDLHDQRLDARFGRDVDVDRFPAEDLVPLGEVVPLPGDGRLCRAFADHEAELRRGREALGVGQRAGEGVGAFEPGIGVEHRNLSRNVELFGGRAAELVAQRKPEARENRIGGALRGGAEVERMGNLNLRESVHEGGVRR